MGRKPIDTEAAEKIGRILKSLRERSGESQAEVARALDLNQNSLSYYEGGAGIPSLDLAAKMASFYNVSLDYLVGLTDVSTKAVHPSSVLDAVVALAKIPGIHLHAPMFPSTEAPVLTFDADSGIASLLREYYTFLHGKTLSLPVSESSEIQDAYYSSVKKEEHAFLKNLHLQLVAAGDDTVDLSASFEEFLLNFQKD